MIEFVQLKDLKGLEVIEIRQFENSDRDRPDFQNRYLKILYFILHEGIRSTMRKYLAHKLPQIRYLTLLRIRHDQKEYFNISVQFNQDPKYFVLMNMFYKCPNLDYNEISNNLDYYFTQFNQFAECSNYALLGNNICDSVSFDIIPQKYSERYQMGLFVYGLGGYVKMFIIQHFRKLLKIGCIDYKMLLTEEFKKNYGFKYGFVSPLGSFPLLMNVDRPIVIIATFHSDHASLAYEVFKRNPKSFVFIEKPPAVTLEDLDKLVKLYKMGARLEIGFNRRFIEYNRYVRNLVKDKVIYITCSVKEVLITENHWYHWKNQGTRITGNAVHWFDLANFWIDSNPVEINMISNPYDCESSAISVLYKNGSVLNLTVTDKGNSMRGVQEKIEIRFEDETIFIDDYLSLTYIKKSGIKVKKLKWIRDKGHNAMYKNFLRLIKEDKNSEYKLHDLIRTTLITYYASEMLTRNIRNMNIEKEINHYLTSATSGEHAFDQNSFVK